MTPGRWGVLFHHRRQRQLFSLGPAGAVGALGWPVRFKFPPFRRDCVHFHSCFVLNTYPLMLYLSRHVYLTQRNNRCLRGLRSIFLAFMGILVFPSLRVIFIHTSGSSMLLSFCPNSERTA